MVGDRTDARREAIRPLLPPQRGRPRAVGLRTLNGILYVLRTGCRWGASAAAIRGSGDLRAAASAVAAGGRLGTYRALLVSRGSSTGPKPSRTAPFSWTRGGRGGKRDPARQGQQADAGDGWARASHRRAGSPCAGGRGSVGGGDTADKGYASRAFRHHLRRRGIRPCIPYRRNRHRCGRQPDPAPYCSC